mgnify:CR=1 FL=1
MDSCPYESLGICLVSECVEKSIGCHYIFRFVLLEVFWEGGIESQHLFVYDCFYRLCLTEEKGIQYKISRKRRERKEKKREEKRKKRKEKKRKRKEKRRKRKEKEKRKEKRKKRERKEKRKEKRKKKEKRRKREGKEKRKRREKKRERKEKRKEKRKKRKENRSRSTFCSFMFVNNGSKTGRDIAHMTSKFFNNKASLLFG